MLMEWFGSKWQAKLREMVATLQNVPFLEDRIRDLVRHIRRFLHILENRLKNPVAARKSY
eukprot:1079350-Rhodomonas_salina.1